jgi:hypothetical protein
MADDKYEIISAQEASQNVGAPKKWKPEITGNVLEQMLTYNPDTGIFVWRISDLAEPPIAGTLKQHGYIWIVICGVGVYAHRLAWLWMSGCWPRELIDHINGDKSDNRFCNLREANKMQNMMNQGARADSKTGIRGVTWHKENKNWIVRIRANGDKYLHLGSFADFDEACARRKEAEKQYYGQFARTGE